jgi:hypothetical protein
MVPERQTPEHSARHILRLIVGHFHAMPGRVLREASLVRIFSSDGWQSGEYQPGRDYALERGWLSGAVDRTLTLTAAGYTVAFDSSSSAHIKGLPLT